MKRFSSWILVLLIPIVLHAEEGMYPLSEIHKLNLKAKGFKISSKDIYNPDGISLVDASVRVGGCSGSFISREGLIITNHHCVFGAVQLASTVKNDYVRDGFLAQTRELEIPAKGITCRIVDSYRDVSKEVLSEITDTVDASMRVKIIDKKIKEIVAEAEKKHTGILAEVAEMFPGKTYVLFVYKTIRDVRLVYVPPRSVGEFGGANENWVWPRHTGDFSFVRAYVGKDGSAADYSAENVPYQPKKYLRVNPNGVEEEDNVFILGYPGKTFRHQPSYYLEYERDIRLPYIQLLNEWKIAQMEVAGKDDPAVALMLTDRIKSLANVEKNYRGKLKRFKSLPILENKQKEEEKLTAYIDADPLRKQQYGNILEGFKAVYEEMKNDALRNIFIGPGAGVSGITYGMIVESSTLLTLAHRILKLADERQKPDMERTGTYMERNILILKQNSLLAFRNAYVSIDKLFLREMLFSAARLPSQQRIDAVMELVKGADTLASIQHVVDAVFARTRMTDSAFVAKALEMTPEQIAALNDPLIEFARSLIPEIEMQSAIARRRSGELNRLMAKLVEVKQQWQKKDFIPDANSTLRLTFGKIRGYSPADAVYYSPITTLRGLIEKSSDDPDYNTPQKIRALSRKKDFGRYQNKKLNDVPVGILYDMDTTGGNSGSPILNAKGELVGVNFDRAFEATINDFAWNQSYSRSIGVDIRYILWTVEKVAEAGFLLKEIGVK